MSSGKRADGLMFFRPRPDQQLSAHLLSKQALGDDDRDAEESVLSDDLDVDMGSDDADFEVDSPALDISAARDARSSSEESRRPPRQKARIEDDEEIMNNPELYGIRRSVSSNDSSARGNLANMRQARSSCQESLRPPSEAVIHFFRPEIDKHFRNLYNPSTAM